MPWYDSLLEEDVVPDLFIRSVIRHNCEKRLADETQGGLERQQERFMQLVDLLSKSPIAVDTAAANEQHYEVPTKFFQLVLGKNLKYSSGYWKDEKTTLDRKSTRLNSSHITPSRMPSSA